MGSLVINEGVGIIPDNARYVDGLRRNGNGCRLGRILILPAVIADGNHAVIAAAVKNVLDGNYGACFCDKIAVLIPLIGVGRAGNVVESGSRERCIKSVIGLGYVAA